MFQRFAERSALLTGNPRTFAGALVCILLWGLAGSFLGYSNTWQLVMNTATTIITTLLVLLIQNTTNRTTAALHAKLDELILAVSGARDDLVALEERSEAEITAVRATRRPPAGEES